MKAIPVSLFLLSILIALQPAGIAEKRVLKVENAEESNRQTKSAQPQNLRKIVDKRDMPVATFEIQPGAPKRKRERFGHQPNQIKEILGIETVHSSESWTERLGALPVSTSDLVAVGVVTRVGAYVSSDKSAVFSEFSVVLEDILKYPPTPALAIGSSVFVTREGGKVRFPSGRVQTYDFGGEGSLCENQKYLLFLKYDSAIQDFLLLTAYQLHDGRVTSVDKISRHLAYENWDAVQFLDLVRKAANEPRSPSESNREGEQ